MDTVGAPGPPSRGTHPSIPFSKSVLMTSPAGGGGGGVVSVCVVMRTSSTRYVYGATGLRSPVPMYTCRVLVVASVGVVHVPLTVVQPSAFMFVAPTQVNPG